MFLTCLHVAIIIENIQNWDTVPLNGTTIFTMADENLKTVQRAIALMDSFTLEHPELGVREAARMIHSSPSTTGRLLLALTCTQVAVIQVSALEVLLGPAEVP